MAEQEAAVLARYARSQDAEAFRMLVEWHERMVFSACHRILGNRADAEDASQSCFFQLALQAGRLRAPIAGWLHTVAVSGSIDMLRQKTSRSKREARAAQRDGVLDHEVSWHEIRSYVDEAITVLPEELRVPLVMRYLEGRKQEAIADELGISQPAVSGRLKRGVELLRKRLKRMGVALPAVALAPMLLANATEAAPLTLTAALGKMAVAGVGAGTAGAAAASVGVVGALKLALAGAVAVGALIAVCVAVKDLGQKALASRAAPQAATAPAGSVRGVGSAPISYSASVFSPGGQEVLDVTLNDDGAGRNMFIDFDSGQLFSIPPDVAELDVMLKWMRDKGIDAFYERTMNKRSIIAADMNAMRALSEMWDAGIPLETIQRDLPASKDRVFPIFLSASGELPTTIVFRTREGGAGLLQILGFDQQVPGSVDIRYRLVPQQ